MGERRDVTFGVNGQRCSAWLCLPESPTESLPCVVMAHGTTGTKDFACHRMQLASSRYVSGYSCSTTATSAREKANRDG